MEWLGVILSAPLWPRTAAFLLLRTCTELDPALPPRSGLNWTDCQAQHCGAKRPSPPDSLHNIKSAPCRHWHSYEESVVAAKRFGCAPRTDEPSPATELRFGTSSFNTIRQANVTAFPVTPNV
jgi:hypothetical protein